MEQICKLQPDRTMYLRGFAGFGAAAALHSASAEGFTVSGVFRDAADFAVLVIYDAYDYFGHHRLKWLPDFDLSGVRLTFDVRYTNLQTIDSPKFPAIDWPYLNVIRADATTARIPLFEHATLQSGDYTPASGTFHVGAVSGAAVSGDTMTLWYQNIAFQHFCTAGETPDAIAAALAALVNGYAWSSSGGIFSLSAVADGLAVTITADPPGCDGNMIAMYSVATSNLTAEATAKFSGGSSDATWSLDLDLTALGIDQVRQMWLTFAPALADGAAYVDAEWDAVFSNWIVTGAKRSLQVAGPNSVRVDDADAWCQYSGASWAAEAGFWLGGFAHRMSTPGDSVTVQYACGAAHDVWIGTALYVDRGRVAVSIDGAVPVTLDAYLSVEPQVIGRLKVASGIAAGPHTVTITLLSVTSGSARYFYFDYLEAAAASDVPDADAAIADCSPAIDYDTDHGYKLAPARLMWMFDQLGFAGPMNEYVGVFWWNQRKASGRVLPAVTVTIGGMWVAGDQMFVTVGDQAIGKTVFTGETTELFARHLAYFVNETYSGVWAQASGATLTISSRSAGPAYRFGFSVGKESAGGVITYTGSLSDGAEGTWVIDGAAATPVNYAAVKWHEDLYRCAGARSLEVTSALSFELTGAPAEWAARYPDGSIVETGTVFGPLRSTQCAPGLGAFVGYQRAAFLQLSQMQQAAGLAPSMQVGEPVWWFFAGASGMGYYDAATVAAATSALGRTLVTFHSPDDDPSVNGYADANFLRGRLRDHVQAIRSYVQAAIAGAVFEVLYAYDVNYPRPKGVNSLGGRLNHWVNTPAEWRDPGSGYLERIKIEALDWCSGTRSLTLARETADLALGWSWPADRVRYLFPVFNGGCPLLYDQQYARGLGLKLTPFAMDHVCLFGLELGADPRPAVQSL